MSKEEALSEAGQQLSAELGKLLAGLIADYDDYSHETYLELENDSDKPLKIEVSEVENSDWDGDSRPDQKFNGVEIPPHDKVKHRQEINAKSSTAMSTMKFSQDDEVVIDIRVDQCHAKAIQEKQMEQDLGNGWKARVTAGVNGNELQYRFAKS
ncbi:unnamed protein product [Adineta steineri]|uniref:Uncharacterized protein n=1 Tax=Adineta steineri TaxID=433720 RepID=A0A820EL88_9BILA|nr:unnamed protein product [Adineta steineri]